MVARDSYFKVLDLAIFCLSVRFTLQLSIWIILLCESTVYTVRHFVFASLSRRTRGAIYFGFLASELADKPYIDYRKVYYGSKL